MKMGSRGLTPFRLSIEGLCCRPSRQPAVKNADDQGQAEESFEAYFHNWFLLQGSPCFVGNRRQIVTLSTPNVKEGVLGLWERLASYWINFLLILVVLKIFLSTLPRDQRASVASGFV